MLVGTLSSAEAKANQTQFVNDAKAKKAQIKAQIITLDFLIFSMILMVILFMFISKWNFLGIRWNNINDYNMQYNIALFASEMLVTSPDNPASWENLQNITENISFGLVNERNVVNEQKLNRLINLSLQNYSLFKKVLGAGNYEVFINVTNMNRSLSYYNIGSRPGQLNETVAFERYVIFNGSVSLIKLEVWK